MQALRRVTPRTSSVTTGTASLADGSVTSTMTAKMAAMNTSAVSDDKMHIYIVCGKLV